MHITLGGHGVHHVEFFFVLLLGLLILYFPPRAFSGLARLHTFLSEHYGDSIGLLLLFTSISLIIVGDVWQGMTHTAEAGNSLLLAAMGVLKLTKTPPNGNGNGSSYATPPAAPSSPPSAPLPEGWGAK